MKRTILYSFRCSAPECLIEALPYTLKFVWDN